MATRAEQRRSTLIALGGAAVDLFESQGPSVTADEIAARAGVSRRTLHRWCDTKEELAFVHPVLWLDVFTDAIAEEAQDPDALGQTLSARLRLASLAIARYIDSDPEPARQAFLVAATHPELLRGFHAVYQRWVDALAAEAESRGIDSFDARVIASSVMGMVDATTRAWLAGGPDASYETTLERGLATIATMLERADEVSDLS